MKKLTISMLIIFVICIINTVNVFAADATAEFIVDKTTVKAGDTVTVILNAKCESGLSAVITGVEYDKEVLTLQNTEVAENWVNYGVDKYEILSNSTEKVTSLNVITLTFNVSDKAQDGTTKISTTGIEITDINNKEYTLGKSEKVLTIGNPNENPTPSEPEENPKQVTLTNIKITKAPTKTTYTEGENFDKTEMVVTAEYSDGTSKETTNYEYTPNEALKITDEKVTISYTEGEVTKTVDQEITVINAQKNNTEDNKEDIKDDSITPDKEIPKAGVEKNIILVIGLVLIVTIATYLGYKKYKNI